MLLDLLHLLTTPAPRAQRRLGYLRDSIWLMSRARRCRRAWAPHLEASRAVMRAAIAGVERRDTAVVLGSGLLLDVPLADLAGAFRRVVLVDAVHLRPARRAIRAFPNVEALTADLSGAMALMTGAARDLDPGLPSVCAAPETGLVISANLLSQLPIRPVERLEASRRPLGPWTPNDGDAFGRRIIEGHLDALAGLTARVCLVTDLDEIEEDRQEQVHARHDLLYGVRLGNPESAWSWELAPFGEMARNRRLIHRVAGFSNWRP
ncbi:hypothetical protein MPPM_2386 [Methylorubrum populi]|uniref:Class I SAM-dependent methyltransferase n=1 Tax=Methylorubrum populi TaxID=223967 RepID=A0A160PGS3_9HYPH|nr:hypothetical protein [Methylorubrum populi]BAU90991.1 hypothetical protein MPPM_2386 [Methylorubrum populi]